MSWLKVKELLLRGGANPISNFLIAASTETPGVLKVQRGAAGGGSADILEVSATGDLILSGAVGEPNPRGAVMQMMMAKVLPKLIPAVEGLRSFVKTSGKTISIKAGTTVLVGGMFKTYAAQTAVVMPDVLTPGEDYSIWVLPSGDLFAAKDSKPAPYAPTPAQAGAVKVGGFHYGLLAHDALLGGGGFAQSAPSMIWTQADVDKIAGINAHSMWDEGYRPACDPRGMACVSTSAGEGLFWFDIYFTGTEHITNGTSRAGTDVASGAVQPKIPAMFGGDGTSKYTTFNWYEANEIAFSHGKRLLSYQEFSAAAFGVTENLSLGGAASTIPLTKRSAGYTSKWGGEQMTGHQFSWGGEFFTSANTALKVNVSRGRVIGQPYSPCFGGSSQSAAGDSGSRSLDGASFADGWTYLISLRAACDHKRHQ